MCAPVKKAVVGGFAHAATTEKSVASQLTSPVQVQSPTVQQLAQQQLVLALLQLQVALLLCLLQLP